MYHLDNTSGVPEMPEPKEQQSITPRWFGESQEQGGISWPGADWFNTVQAELLNLLAAAGLTPEKHSFDQLSKAIPVLGDARLRSDLGSALGALFVSLNEANLEQLIPPSILRFMKKADIEMVMGNPGADVLVDYAFQKAVDEGFMSVYMPWGAGAFNCSEDVTLPAGFNIFTAGCRRPYLGTSDAVFNATGALIRKAPGASGIFKLTGRHTFKDVIFDGRDKSVGLINSDSQVSGCRFINCGSYRWLRGFGRTTGYTATLFLSGCSINNNYDGIFNLIDSKGYDLVINANDNIGINLGKGANNNAFSHVRTEWNRKEGLMVYAAKAITFSNETIDRNGAAGVAVVNGGELQLSTVSLQRNGKYAASGSADNCHIRVEGDGSKLIATNVRTTAGADDDGQGNVSPEYGLITSGGSQNMTLVIGDGILNGVVIAPSRSITTAAIRKYQNVVGLPDTSTEGLTQIRGGIPNIGDPVENAYLPVHGTLNFSLEVSRSALGTFSTTMLTRTIEFQARNNTMTTPETYYLKVRISRVSAGEAVIQPLGVGQGSATTWGMSGESPAAVSVVLAVSSDGRFITGTLTGIDNGERYINIFLRA